MGTDCTSEVICTSGPWESAEILVSLSLAETKPGDFTVIV